MNVSVVWFRILCLLNDFYFFSFFFAANIKYFCIPNLTDYFFLFILKTNRNGFVYIKFMCKINIMRNSQTQIKPRIFPYLYYKRQLLSFTKKTTPSVFDKSLARYIHINTIFVVTNTTSCKKKKNICSYRSQEKITCFKPVLAVLYFDKR